MIFRLETCTCIFKIKIKSFKIFMTMFSLSIKSHPKITVYYWSHFYDEAFK